MAPPSEDVPVSLALSDENHAVSVTDDLRRPVHLDIQFRKNLVPDAGGTGGDHVGSITSLSTIAAQILQDSIDGRAMVAVVTILLRFGQNIDLAMFIKSHFIILPGSLASKPALSLTTIIVNNNGGGIFSFLPIAKHGNDVNVEECFGTPTNSFEKGAEAFGLPFDSATELQQGKEQRVSPPQRIIHSRSKSGGEKRKCSSSCRDYTIHKRACIRYLLFRDDCGSTSAP